MKLVFNYDFSRSVEIVRVLCESARFSSNVPDRDRLIILESYVRTLFPQLLAECQGDDLMPCLRTVADLMSDVDRWCSSLRESNNESNNK